MNEGLYISYGEILYKLSIVSDPGVSKSQITLSNKLADSAGDLFDYVIGVGATSPSVGDAIRQNGKYSNIIEVLTAPDRIRIEETDGNSLIVAGTVNLLHSDIYDRFDVETEIKTQMEFIDLNTRQWFNARNKTIRLEGKNSNVLFLPVPIISVSEIKLNGTNTGVDLSFFEIFGGAGNIPDNRRNPRIKLLNFNQSIFVESNHRVFKRGLMTNITGWFGWIEADGSTPELIKRATAKLVIACLKEPSSSIGAGSDSTGAKKAERVDLHETEYYKPDDTVGGPTGAISGDLEVDRILKMYRGPIAIGGSILDHSTIETLDVRDDYYPGEWY